MKENKESSQQQNQQTTFDLSANMIEQTRKIIANMNETQRFHKAKAHIYDALNFKHPRFESQSATTPFLFKLAYSFQSSSIWSWLLFLSGYVFICLAAIDSEYYVAKLVSEAVILSLFWMDNIIVLYCKSFDRIKENKRYSSFFYIKFIIIILMTVDLIIFICLPCYNSRPIRPFRIFRCMVPVIFDPEMRKCLISLASAYKDILVYLIFYSTIIVGYAFIGSKTLTFDASFVDPNYPQYVDPYRSNYSNLSSMIFIVYVTATYDAYPDNQTLVIQNQESNYIYFIVFIFLNMFLFSSIPGSLIYFRFKEKRSKIILIDEIRQHHSLLLAFVTLANQHSKLSIQKLIDFFLFLYRYKIRYVEYIADICLKLDTHSKNSIQANQFMQMNRILLENSALLPPVLDDFGPWVSFRKIINQKLYLKQIASTWIFQLIVSILILLAFINSIYFISNPSVLVEIFDDVFAWIFLVELMVRIIGFGPQLFFSDKWNIIDTILVIAGIGVSFTHATSSNVLLKIGRIFRIFGILRIVSHSNFRKRFQFELLEKLINIYSVLLQILPIILRFMPLFLFFFYIYGIIGMELFYNFYDTKGVIAYNQYQQFSDFKSLQHSLYIMVQVLTEAGWSFVAMDHCWRAPQYYGYIMVFFCFLHITIVYILATLIRGVFWEVYVTVEQVLKERSKIQDEEELKEEQFRNKTIQIKSITQQIQSKQYLKPRTIMRRDLLQNRTDEEIFRRLIKVSQRSKTQKLLPNGRQNAKRLTSASKSIQPHYNQMIQRTDSQRIKMPIGQIEDIDDEDVQYELSQLLDKFLVDPIYKYHEVVETPKIFLDFIKSKFISDLDSLAQNTVDEDDVHSYPLYKQDAINFHISQLKSILGLQVSKRQQKTLIMQSLVGANVITQEESDRLIKKKLHQKKFQIDTRGIMRKLFLEGTNEDLIQKLYTQYFSGLYGSSFKRINRLTLEPLLKLEAKLTYALKNIMRYPQINYIDFFQILTTIQSNISAQLLQKGSIFKFIFKLDYEGEIWFWVQCKKPKQELKVHFMKNGIWCYFQQMNQQVYYAKDIFDWKIKEQNDRKDRAQYMKKFFQTFEAFSLSLVDQQAFFEDDPRKYIYDLYIQLFNVRKNQRFVSRKLQIEKIMVVILSKQELRQNAGLENIQYSLSDIKPKKSKWGFNLQIDQNDSETLSKLKNLAADEEQKIIQSQGLPFSYIVDLMKEIKEILDVSVNNLIYQTEKAFNRLYEQKMSENAPFLRAKDNSSKVIVKDQYIKQNTVNNIPKPTKKIYPENQCESESSDLER